MKTRLLVKEGEYRLAKAFCMDAKIDAEELYCFLTGTDKVGLFLKANEEVDEETEEKYMELIRKRAERIPLQHITGTQEFMGHVFKVTPDVLIPRQDTETLVEEAARTIQKNPGGKKSFLQKLLKAPDWQRRHRHISDEDLLQHKSGGVGHKPCGHRSGLAECSGSADEGEVCGGRHVQAPRRQKVRHDSVEPAVYQNGDAVHTSGGGKGS